jgi:pyruvate formate lyase activating enzyme
MMNNHSALVTNIQGYSIHDGPGIRTVVFLKGCGLECQWCSNPECISPHPEVGFIKTLCTQCGQCAEVCPEGALVYEAGKFPYIDRKQCNGCGVCSSVCSYQALVLYGKPMSTDEVFDAVEKDRMFYQASGGGVTVSGGEPLLQPGFVGDLLEKCRRAGIHTCLETSGYAAESALRQVLPYTDYILYDLKHLNSEKHRRYTGQPNGRILANAEIVAASGVETLFRMPLVPGINDDLPNIKETAEFLHGLGNNAPRIELMPYHRLGKGKYEALDRPYPLSGLLSPEPEHLESIKKAFEDNGTICMISR